MSERKLVRMWYRSRTQNGRLWTETSNLDELLEQAAQHPAPSTLTFERCETYEITEPWVRFEPVAGENKHAEVSAQPERTAP